MPDGDIRSEEDVSHYCCVGRDEYKALVVDIEVVEVHDCAGTVELVVEPAGSLQALGGEE